MKKIITYSLLFLASCISQNKRIDIENDHNNFRFHTLKSLKIIEFNIQCKEFDGSLIEKLIINDSEQYKFADFFEIGTNTKKNDFANNKFESIRQLIENGNFNPIVYSGYDFKNSIKINDSLSHVLYDYSLIKKFEGTEFDNFIKSDLFWNKRKFCTLYFYRKFMVKDSMKISK